MNMRVGSPRPKVQPFSTPGAPQRVEQQAAQTLQTQSASPVSARDVDEFLKARQGAAQKAAGGGFLPSLTALLDGVGGGGAAKQARQSEASALQQHLHTAVNELRDVYRDGRITEPEIAMLGQAKRRLDDIAALFQPAILNMLPRETRERLQNNLLGPVDELREAAGRRLGRMIDGVTRNLESVQANPTPEYGFVDVNQLAQTKTGAGASGYATLNGVDRYAPGDMISVPRSDGTHSLGVVQSVDVANGKLTAEFLDVRGGLATKELDSARVASANPLKIGDCVDTANGRVWVTGTGNGGLRGVFEGPKGQQQVDASWLSALAGGINDQLSDLRMAAQRAAAAPTVQMKAPPATATAPAQAAAAAAVSSGAAGAASEPKVLVAAGGHESTKPEEVVGQGVRGALFTYRGIGYADYNEDGAVLGVVPKGNGVAHETGYAGAFDQAGGMGHAKETGAASKLAAQQFDKAARAVAQGADPESTLKNAVAQAHVDVNALGVGAATTFAAAVVQNGYAHVVNCGDSAVMIFDKHGKLKGQTEAHNLGDIMAKQAGDPNAGLDVANIITSCIGGREQPQADYSRFKIEKGDIIVCVSDGVADANLSAQKKDYAAGKPWTELNGERTTREIGEIVKARANGGPASITQAIIDYATEQVKSGKGKRDNVTASVMTV